MTKEDDVNALLIELESAMNEFRHCQRQGPWWFTNGESALRAQTNRWIDKADAAIEKLKALQSTETALDSAINDKVEQ